MLAGACGRAPAIDTAPVSFRAAPGSPRATFPGVHDVACLDADGNGVMDVVLAIDELGGVVTMLGDGAGGFGNAQMPGVRTPARHSVVVADLDHDGRDDYVASHHDSHDVGVVRSGDRGGMRSFAARTEGKPHNHGLAVADVDRDGDLDVITSDQDAGSIALLVGDGTGNFAIAPGSPWAVGASPYPPAIGDLDGDGNPDVASPLVEGAAIAVLLGDGKGGFTRARGEPGPIAARPYAVALGDLDGDRKLDAVVAHDDATKASILRGDGSGGLSWDHDLELGGRAADVALVDVDGNGALDLVAAAYPAAMLLMLGDGKGSFAHAPGSPFPLGGEPSGVAACDVSGDGKLDLVAASGTAQTLSVWLRT